MNCTLRLTTTRRTLVVKQGRPWVEKYPDIPAPDDRSLIEAAFYAQVRAVSGVADRMPALYGLDPESRVLLLEDCAGFSDLTDLHAKARLDDSLLVDLLEYLRALHALPVDEHSLVAFRNDAMRRLNHEYIFCLPLANQAALHGRLETITPGLADAARFLSADEPYVSRVHALGDTYLHGETRVLVHGDFFPGSWLSDGTRVKVIDPEFCFAGAPEFDYGVMAAHLILGDQEPAIVRRIVAAAGDAGCDEGLVAAFAGVEIMRRLIGVAQLPRLDRTLREKADLLRVSRNLVGGEMRLGGG